MSEAGGLALRDVTVRFGSTVAVDGLSLDVAAGEIVAVIGPSGSGKSTLLRAIAGLEPLAAGTIEAGGRPLDGVPTHKRDLGLMFQDHALFPHLSVADNVGFGLAMQSIDADRRAARVDELLELVGLSSFGGRSVTELSGGEAQRVALARALAPRPALLMLDEPFGSLDRVLREQLTGEVRRLLRELGQTALHVTHDQVEAFALADRVAVLAEGRLVQIGRPEQLWRRPASSFVAEFLGHPNRWRVDIGSDGCVALGRFELGSIEPSAIQPGMVSGSWPVGRREAVVPSTALRPDVDGPLPIVVTDARFGDGRYRVEARVDHDGSARTGPKPDDHDRGEPTRIVFETDRQLGPGDRLQLAVDVDQLHVVGHGGGG